MLVLAKADIGKWLGKENSSKKFLKRFKMNIKGNKIKWLQIVTVRFWFEMVWILQFFFLVVNSC